jgi:hypothetical protein
VTEVAQEVVVHEEVEVEVEVVEVVVEVVVVAQAGVERVPMEDMEAVDEQRRLRARRRNRR